MGSLPGGQLLQGPGIAIRVAEGHEGTPRLNPRPRHDRLIVVSGCIRLHRTESDGGRLRRDWWQLGPVLAHLLAGKLRGGTASVMRLWRGIEAAGATRLDPTDPDPSAAADGKGLRVVSPKLADALIALAVAVFGAVGTLAAGHQGGGAPVAAAAILAAMGLSLYPRRRFPGSVLTVVALLVGGLAVVGTSLDGGFIAVLISSYSAAVYGGRRLAFGLATGAVAVLLGIGIPVGLGATWLRSAAPVRILLAAGGAWLVGLVIRGQFSARSAHLETMRERAELAAARQEDEARRATIAERLRIARELHDIVAHHLSVVVIQAQGAQRTIGRNPARAMAAMTQVEQTGRTALEEMRGLLGLLRSGEMSEDGDGPDDGAGPGQTRLARPGLADVGAMAEEMRAAGLQVIMHTVGEPGRDPRGCGPGHLPDSAGGADQRRQARRASHRYGNPDLRRCPGR